MLRHVGAAVAVLALLCGLSAAPYTHAHHAIDSASDAHHPDGATLVHTHATPHAHHEAAPRGSQPASGEDWIWSVEACVFHPPVPTPAPSPVLCEFGEPPVPLIGLWSGVDRPQPKAHGPPIGSPPGLRAPPAILPLSV